MGVVGIILLVVFVIICFLLVGIVLIQSEEGGGMGGLFGGSGSVAFGSRSQTVITKTTYVLVTLFFVISFALAFINKAPEITGLEAAAQQAESVKTGETQYWLDAENVDNQTVPAEASAAEAQN